MQHVCGLILYGFLPILVYTRNPSFAWHKAEGLNLLEQILLGSTLSISSTTYGGLYLES